MNEKMLHPSLLRFASVSALCLAALGCGENLQPDLPTLHAVTGTVRYRGQPADKFRVVFHTQTDIGKLHFAPAAVTDERGNFKLRSYAPDDGAPAGEYLVTFEWPDHINRGDEMDFVPEKDRLRGAYGNPEQSHFRITIRAGENKLPPFNLR
jgi:hypothetical protein